MRKGKRFPLSLMDLSLLSRRDDRTQPGVLTPGVDKGRIRPEGAAEWIVMPQMRKKSGTVCLPPFQGGFVACIIPGLKPRAESFYPFGIYSLLTGVAA